MKILVVNAGSSSLKYQLLDMENDKLLAKGNCEKIGLADPIISYKHDGKEEIFEGAKNHEEAIKKVLDVLVDKKNGVIKSFDEIGAIGHRVVMGGWIFKESTLIDDKVIEQIDRLSEMAPLHNPAHVLCMRACKKVMPNIPQVAVFDTSFHSSMPEKAYMYAIKYEDYEKFHVRRYGAHGTSHRFVTQELAKVLGKDVSEVNAITCHLGNGSSITAIKNGKSVDTSMGLTPLQGVVMGTRSGDIDPTVVQFLCSNKNQSVDQVLNYLNKECGLLGISGISSDHREVSQSAEKGNKRAQLALDLLAYSVKKYIGMYMAVLNGAEAIVFTGGIGENSYEAREQILQDLEYLGIVLDKDKNKNFKRGQIELISSPKSKVKVYVIPTNEELMMAKDTLEIVKNLKNSK